VSRDDVNRVYQVLKEIYPHFRPADADLTFEEFGLDSFDLLELRGRLENTLGGEVPDDDWVGFRTFHEIADYGAADPRAPRGRNAVDVAVKRRICLNMPHMAVGRLSEHWLLRELGDVHWGAVCDALGAPSDRLTDALGNRLYATFVRVRWQGTDSLAAFRENDVLDFDNRLSRFGRSMYFSECRVRTGARDIRADLVTTFAVREGDNTSLLKGEPTVANSEKVEERGLLPRVAQEYKEMRKGQMPPLRLNDAAVSAERSGLFEMKYELNPYQDLNGVNLLYFAAYPLIADICERTFMHHHQKSQRVARDWALESATLARDVFYYGNCDVGDRLVFTLNSFTQLPDRTVLFGASLHRASDQRLIADLFTLKATLG
jgi:probable biosynthetic protein (TIGR04098 family)